MTSDWSTRQVEVRSRDRAGRRLRRAIAWLCVWLAIAAASAAPRTQTPPVDVGMRSALVAATAAPIVIDGALDEAIWRTAPPRIALQDHGSIFSFRNVKIRPMSDGS